MKSYSYYIAAIKVLLGFSFFGLQVAIFYLFITFILIIYLGKKNKHEKIKQGIIRFGFKSFLIFLKIIGYLKIDFKNVKEKDLSNIIVCNHISLLDTVIILANIKNCYVIVNPKFTKNIFLRLVIKFSGYITLKNDSPEIRLAAYKRAYNIISQGSKLLIFPEAHRSHTGDLEPFQKGAFHLSMYLNEKITALYLKANRPFLTSKTIFDSINGEILLEVLPLGNIQPPKLFSFSRKEVKAYTDEIRALFLQKNKFLKIVRENSLMKIENTYYISNQHPHLKGHFEGFPVFPGVSQIQLIKKTLVQALKVEEIEIVHVEKCKFSNMIRPDTELRIFIECKEMQVRSEKNLCSWSIIGDNDLSYSKGTLFYEFK